MTVAAIKPAATVLLLRDGPDGLEVFMVRRATHLGFAGGSHVFPGGRVDDADVRLVADPDLCPPVSGVTDAAMAFRIAAIRETFEESGILLVREGGSGRLIGGARSRMLDSSRRSVANGSLAFGDLLVREGLIPATDLLVPYAHWVTPAVFSKRFDTMFFLALAPADQPASHDGDEGVASRWVTPAEALSQAADIQLEFVTQRNLDRLGRSSTVAEAISAARLSTIVTVHPVVESVGQGRVARLPLEAGYGGPLFDFPAS